MKRDTFQVYSSNSALIIGLCTHGSLLACGRFSVRTTYFPVWLPAALALSSKRTLPMRKVLSHRNHSFCENVHFMLFEPCTSLNVIELMVNILAILSNKAASTNQHLVGLRNLIGCGPHFAFHIKQYKRFVFP